VAAWLDGFEGPLTLGNYVYADGATHVRVSMAVDALVVHLVERTAGVSLAVLATNCFTAAEGLIVPVKPVEDLPSMSPKLIVAALNIAAGVILLRHPQVGAEALTLFAALLFLAGGVFRLAGGVVVRGPQMAWTLVQGAFGLLLGVLVLVEWPDSTRYVLGAFFSLALLFDGLGLIATGVGGRQLIGVLRRSDPEYHLPDRGREEKGHDPS
jgi:phage tail protein X